MNEKRKQVETYIYKYLSMMDPTNKNTDIYKERFSKMSDKDFDTFMHNLKDGKEVLSFYASNIIDKIDRDDLIDVSRKLNVKLFERIKMWDSVTETYYLTTEEYPIFQLPVRRMSQFIDHKLSVPEGDTRIDLLTGQVAKPDKAGAISQVEIQTLYARGLEKTILELVKFRGGDVSAFAEYKRSLEENGSANISNETGSVARSAVIFDVFFSGMHIESNASGV